MTVSAISTSSFVDRLVPRQQTDRTNKSMTFSQKAEKKFHRCGITPIN